MVTNIVSTLRPNCPLSKLYPAQKSETNLTKFSPSFPKNMLPEDYKLIPLNHSSQHANVLNKYLKAKVTQ